MSKSPFPAPSPTTKFIVICRADRKPDGSKGDYELATRRVFGSAMAAERYASGISTSREPIVVRGNFGQLRFAALAALASSEPVDAAD